MAKKSHQKKLWFLLLLIPVAVVLLAVLLPKDSPDDCSTAYVTALCNPAATPNITAQRTTILDFTDSDTELRITDQYILTNTGSEDASLPLVYPVPFFPENEYINRSEYDSFFCVTVDGKSLSDWWGGHPFPEFEGDMHAGLVPERLMDGSYFSHAFPQWPEIGTARVQAVTPEDSPVGGWYYQLVYYHETVTIPAGGSVAVTAQYVCTNYHKILLTPCLDQIPAENHTLHVTNYENTPEIKATNLPECPSGSKCTISLDPGCTDYAIEFSCAYHP